MEIFTQLCGNIIYTELVLQISQFNRALYTSWDKSGIINKYARQQLRSHKVNRRLHFCETTMNLFLQKPDKKSYCFLGRSYIMQVRNWSKQNSLVESQKAKLDAERSYTTTSKGKWLG